MAVDEREMTVRDYWRVVVRRKWIVISAVLMALIGSLLMGLMQASIYEAEAQMLVEPRSGEAVFQQDPTLNVQNLDRAIQTEIRVLEGQQVRARVQSDLGLATLPPPVDGTAVGSTDIVSVKVRSKDPQAAQTLADAYVAAYTETRRDQAIATLEATGAELQAKVDELQVQIDRAGGSQAAALVAQQATFKERLDELQIDAALTTGGASVVKSAELPTDPVEPTPLRSAVLAMTIGLLIGLGAAFLVDYLDDSIRTADDLEALSDTPILAVVPVEPPPDARPIAISEPHEFAVEIYRGLRTNIQFLGLDQPMKVLMVTSSLPSEGKTTTATNLAAVLSQAGHRVVLVDADLRKPRVHDVFNVPPVPGLAEAMLGDPIDLVVSPIDEHLHVVPAGQVPPNPSEMMSNQRASEFLHNLAERYEYVILDAAPILPVSDSVALARWVDAVLVVAQSNRVSRREVRESLGRLERVGASVFGLVLNMAKSAGREGSAYGYGYGYGPAPTEHTESEPQTHLTAPSTRSPSVPT